MFVTVIVIFLILIFIRSFCLIKTDYNHKGDHIPIKMYDILIAIAGLTATVILKKYSFDFMTTVCLLSICVGSIVFFIINISRLSQEGEFGFAKWLNKELN